MITQQEHIKMIPELIEIVKADFENLVDLKIVRMDQTDNMRTYGTYTKRSRCFRETNNFSNGIIV
jgi:hypothetical protein